jgi:rRNA maturation endonuclease Nob1
MSNLRAGEPGTWLNTGSHSFCPACGSPEVKVRQVFTAKPIGSFSLAGMQMKVTGTWAWQYRCFGCGDSGPCDIREGYNARAIREWKDWSPG